MVNPDTIAVLGGGPCAHAVAADLSLAGYDVRLCEHPAFAANIQGAVERGGIEITGQGRVGFARPTLITTDFKAAVSGAKWILLTVPAYAHQPFAEAVAPYLEDGQVVVANPSCSMGALALNEAFRRLGVTAQITCSETSVVTCNAVMTGPGAVRLANYQPLIYFAAFPGNRTRDLLPEFQRFYPLVREAKSVLQTSVEGGNIQAHPAPMILNAGRIEYAQGEFWFYKEGITPSVGRVMDDQERERQLLCSALGLQTMPSHERVGRFDRVEPFPTNAYEAFNKAERLRAGKGPDSLESRYLTEDVPFGLVPWLSMGEAIGVPMPVCRAIVTLASSLRGENYLETGRTMANLGLSAIKDVRSLQVYCETGELPRD